MIIPKAAKDFKEINDLLSPLGCLFIGVDIISHLKTKKIRRGYIVVNTRTGRHSHFDSKYGCYLIKKFIRKNIFPDNPYLQESYRRLTESKKDYKDRYYNINKGMR